ncbi:MAG: ferric reductase-like transmembrane domain-containing protein [Alphaproteobacteria bacterium]
MDEYSTLGLWRGASQITMLWSATLAMLSMVAVVRANALEPIFGGLNLAVRLHRKLGLAAILLLVAHVALLTADSVSKGVPIVEVLVPFSTPNARSMDILVFYALIALGFLAYDKRLRYERWLVLHRGVGLLFVLGTVHAAMEPGTINEFEPLRTWIVILLLAGAAAWTYRILLFGRFGPHYAYQLHEAKPRGSETIDLIMRPQDRRMMYEPGTFVFLGVPGFENQAKELHPFSISSSPVDRELRVSIRQIGDFTKRLSDLQKGDAIDIYGPFGSFSPQRFAKYRRLVWVGAGIGITPFLGMLAFEQDNHDFRRIWLYYVAHNQDHAVYDKEISDSFMEADSFIDYQLWDTSVRGHITAKQIADDVVLDDYAVMLCGTPAFVADMAAQFQALGLPRSRIIAEVLEFR